MPISYSWLVEGRIVQLKSSGEITLNDIQKEDAIMMEFLEQTTAPLVHVLADQTDLEKMPDIKSFTASHWVKDKRVGWFLVYGMKYKFLRFAMSVGAQIFQLRTRTFDTHEEALAFLQSVDETLPDLGVAELYEGVTIRF